MLTRRSFLMAAPASACALAACTTTVTSVPTPAKNYDIDLIERAPPTLKVSPRCHPCEAFGSLYIEEETLRRSDHAPITTSLPSTPSIAAATTTCGSEVRIPSPTPQRAHAEVARRRRAWP